MVTAETSERDRRIPFSIVHLAGGKAIAIWTRFGPWLLAALFAGIIFALLVQKHNAFNTRTYDFARFAQAIWNSLSGRLLFTSIDFRSILGNHFSPYMALLAPLFWVWPNERVLFLVQAISVAATGLILAQIVSDRFTKIAPWFLLAFYLNPALQELALFEFRRVVLAMPFIAAALLALYRDSRRWMLLWLLIALLAKEDIGLVVFGFGLFYLLFRRNWRWGLGLMSLGFAWSVVIGFWVIPAFREAGSEYPQLFYFDYLGDSYGQIAQTLLHDPFILARQLLTAERLQAVWRILLPLGIFVPFLASDWLLIALPSILLLLLSGDIEIYGLEKWYPASFLPILFAAAGIALIRRQKRAAQWLMAWMLLATAFAFWLFGSIPGGGRFEADIYRPSAHDNLGRTILASIPPRASVATQPHYVPHLIQRLELFHYPWIKSGYEDIDYLLLDSESDPYPLSKDELFSELTAYLADPNYPIVADADGIYLFAPMLNNEHAYEIGLQVDNLMHLDGFDLAVAGDDGILENSRSNGGEFAQLGETIRVDLYWRALGAIENERTVSVRIVDGSGKLWAQHDGLPGQGSKPTSWWQDGWQVRDIHYLTLPADMPTDGMILEVVVYDSFSGQRLPFDNGLEALPLGALELQ